MTYKESADLVRAQGDFMSQVQIAMLTTALDVLGTTPDTGADPTGLRLALAHRVLEDSSLDLFRFMWALGANPSISSSSSDGDVLFSVNAVWSQMAGIDPA